MRHHKWYIIMSLLFIFVTAAPTWAWHGSKFTPMDYPHKRLICEKVYPPSGQGATLVTGTQGEIANITLMGPCSLSLWDENAEKFEYFQTWWVSYHGTYNYSTNRASETVSYQGDTILKHSITCSENPWAHTPSCKKSSRIVQVVKYLFNPDSSFKSTLYNTRPLSAQPGVLQPNVRTAIAEWETWKSNKALLADWSPLDDSTGGPPALTIKKPSESQPINVNDDWLYIIVKVNPGFEEQTYLLEMERLEEVSGEIVESTGKTHMWQPTGALIVPSLLPLPILIKTSSLIKGILGSYRVRVRGNKGGYTQWRHFQILDKGKFVATESLLRQSKKKTGGFVPKSGEKTMQTKQGESPFGAISKKAPKIQGGKSIAKGGNMGPKSGKAHYKFEKTAQSNDQRKPTAAAQINRKKFASRTIETPNPDIVVQSFVYTVPQGRKAGEPFYEGEGTTLSISFRNKGKAKSGKNHKYTISCVVKSGGPECPVQNETKSIVKEIDPNGTYLVVLSVTLKKAGEYHVTVKVTGARSVSQKTVVLNVMKKHQIQVKPKRKIRRGVPVPK